MSDNKFTTAETLEALACCSEEEKCHSCPYNGTECLHGLPLDALALINRQRAEIARLEEKYNTAVAEREANVKGFTEALKTIENAGVKKFAERVKDKLQDLARWENGNTVYFLVGEAFIDNLVKECTEGRNNGTNDK